VLINERYRNPKGQTIMDILETHAALGTQDEDKQKQKHNTERLVTLASRNNPGWTYVLGLLLILARPVKVLPVIEERKNLRKMEKSLTICKMHLS